MVPIDYVKRVTLLDAHAITTAEAATAVGTTTDLGSAKYLCAEAIFTYGSGGTTAKCYVQTSFDGGTTWIDIISFAFATASATKVSAVTTMIAPGTQAFSPADGALTDNTVVNGVLGDRVRLKYVTTGTYASTTLTIKIIVKG